MRQAAGALLRGVGRMSGSSPVLRSFSGLRAVENSSNKHWLACISPLQNHSRAPLESFHTVSFSTAAASQNTPPPSQSNNVKDGQPAGEEPSEGSKGEPVCKSGKDEKKVTGKGGEGGKVGGEGGKGDGEKKAGDKPAAEEKKVPETAEQKLLKELRKLEQELREKDSLVEEKDETIKELKNNVLLAYADLENFRERAKKDNESVRKYSVQAFSKDLLDVSDNLSRALSSVGQAKDANDVKKTLETLVEGVKMTEKQLLHVFKTFGVQKYDPTGEPFDPNVHLAVCEVADPSKPVGTVASVFKVGYLLHERVLRPAEVAVVKAAEAAA